MQLNIKNGPNTQLNRGNCRQYLKALRVVVVLQALGAQPLLKSKISEQLEVGLRDFPPALLLIHHLLKTTQDTQAQLLQRLNI